MTEAADPDVLALRLLLGNSVSRRREVADALGVNEQTLYQISRGVRMKSGRPRSVGVSLRTKLDQRFPEWRSNAGSYAATSHPAPPTLPAALPVVLDALALAPNRDELRQLLPLLVDTDAPAYRQRLAELLAPEPAQSKPQRAA